MSEDLKAILAALTTALGNLDRKVSSPAVPSSTTTLTQASALLGTFIYDPESENTFPAWFARNKRILEDGIENVTLRADALLKSLGQTEYKRLRCMISPSTPESKTYEQLIIVLSDIFGPSKSLFRRRHDILNMRAAVGTAYEEIIDLANIKGDEFELNNLSSDQLKIFLALNIASGQSFRDLRSVILRAVDEKPTTTIKELRDTVRRFVSRSEDINHSASTDPTTSDVNQVRYSAGKKGRLPRKEGHQKATQSLVCKGCNGQHTRSSCPFRQAECNKCHKAGHIAKACLSTKSAEQPNNQLKTVIEFNEVSAATENFRIFIEVEVNGIETTFRVDSGADVTTIGLAAWKRLGSPHLKPLSSKCNGVSGEPLQVLGYFTADFAANGHSATDRIVVLKQRHAELLGGMLPFSLGLLAVSPSVQALSGTVELNSLSTDTAVLEREFHTLFDSKPGRCSKLEVALPLKRSVNPTHLRPRPVALGVRELLDKELDRLLESGIITAVESSDWAAPIVVARKANGQIRMCADFSTGLNDALRDIDYPLPNMEEVMTKFTGNRVFSQLDLSDAYFQLPLEQNSRPLTTITTHRGLFQYNRLVFGLKTAPAIFQRTMEQALAGLEGVLVYLDDLLVMAWDQASHDSRLRQVLQRLESWGFKLRFPKCSFSKNRVKYLGMIISEDGIEPDPLRVKAIKELRAPKNVSEVRALLGLINYYGKFLERLHHLKTPFEDLLKKDVDFKWKKTHQDHLERVQQALSEPLLLAHYDPKQTLIVAADACDTGIGGVLLQRYPDGNEKAVFHISKSLSPSQRNYSQIEKEALALVTTVERLRKFVWGRKFILQTDHQPLLALFRPSQTRGLSERTAARLRRWALRLIGFDFEIEYIKTTKFGHADALSRLIDDARQAATDPEFEEVIALVELGDQEVHQLATESLRILQVSVDKVRQAIARDPTLTTVMTRIRDGWQLPDRKDPDLKPFLQQAEAVSISQGVLLLDDRVIVPTSLRSAVLKKLHAGHPGIRRMKALARLHFYWPGMSSDVEKLVRSCAHCLQNADNPVKVPLVPWPDAQGPWRRVHLDFAEPTKGNAFLVIVDSFSRYVDASWIKPATSQNLITYMRLVFRHFGPPETIVTDNGRQFTSMEFAKLCEEFHVVHLRTAPRHPQSNGQAERMVHTLKDSLNAHEDSLDVAVAAYNYTPNTAIGDKTPAEVFFGRPIRTPFHAFKPVIGAESLTEWQRQMKNQFDLHNGARARQFKVGEEVSVELANGNRVQAKIVEFQGHTMAKLVHNGSELVRHFNQLWKRSGPSVPRDPMDLTVETERDRPSTPSPEAAPSPPSPEPLPPSPGREQSALLSPSAEPAIVPPARHDSNPQVVDSTTHSSVLRSSTKPSRTPRIDYRRLAGFHEKR